MTQHYDIDEISILGIFIMYASAANDDLYQKLPRKLIFFFHTLYSINYCTMYLRYYTLWYHD